MGLVVAMLSLTGIVIWLKKRQARLRVSYERRVSNGNEMLEVRGA
jgi:uncharacterized iron-regulated membrane protein